MQFRRIRFENFTITIFTAHAGEERVCPPSELTRGLTASDAPAIAHLLEGKDDARPLHTIPVYTKGGFEALGGDHAPDPRPAGSGATQFVRGIDNYKLRATAADSEYHCITPKSKEPVFWQRSFVGGKAGDTFEVLPNSYLYIAEGKIELAHRTFVGPTMLEITKPHTAKITDPVMGAKLWR
ncbi:hypothetical protein [Bradyrhizobium elkanii]|uniref:Uncharacterized protein n=1 Tax=Bradyrhizobium elkanii TaxID=29448 RepID=A0ABV4F085_BRAEL|nr:hypothetical protein [Bradyrhizobium elkanii]MCP1757857.1 hypothetical protein [Bradyrhizobium elkanii]MCS3881846.1 hypothetical protein [Bradyrhizobium elkanii]MCS4218605.1 hypothetical protein [Bradyrhizobium elkanii]MCW2110095.1 hypothetical protein [Bradyrhizobium elkanii]MCW2201533.1 hypothetical protein [Bradyrhizobium elkanii]